MHIMLLEQHTKISLRSNGRIFANYQNQVAVHILFYELTNSIQEDPYIGFLIRKFLHYSNITYYHVPKFGDDPTVGSSIHTSTYSGIVMNLGSITQSMSINYQHWTLNVKHSLRMTLAAHWPRAAARAAPTCRKIQLF